MSPIHHQTISLKVDAGLQEQGRCKRQDVKILLLITNATLCWMIGLRRLGEKYEVKEKSMSGLRWDIEKHIFRILALP